LELVVCPTLCFKNSHVDTLSIAIRGLVIIVAHASDAKETEETDVLLSIVDMAVITGY
jgi:hypothetical protein